ncbi:hypothetical protein [Methanolobus sp. WCC5]|uniref:hypothetical protein n=1 Tax=Methanolobus sp. WCC5 TaxID=3125785 RepID=UPI00324E08F1
MDGQHGTTGLLVNERLTDHPEVEILEISYEKRHDRNWVTDLTQLLSIVEDWSGDMPGFLYCGDFYL